MNIEIYSPQNEVPEHVIFYLKGKLIDFYRRDKQINKTEVVLRHQQVDGINPYVCEVTLSLYGELIMIHRSGRSYLQAITQVLREISKVVDEFFEHRSELPDKIATTVMV